MNSWMVCPACRLRHVRRLDRVCPRCGQAVDFTPDPGFVIAKGRRAQVEETGLPRGARIAGGFLAAAGVLVLAQRALAPIAGPTARVSVPIAVLDVLVGALLVSRYEKVVGLARARVIAGAMIFSILFVGDHRPLMGAFQLAFLLSFLVLLWGRPSPMRIRVGSALLAGFLLIQAASVAWSSLARRLGA